MRDALLIYNTYKKNTQLILENNIYRVIDDIEEIRFPKVDLIVKSKADFFLDKKNHDRVAEYYLHDVTLNDRNQCLQLARKEAVSCLERLDRVYEISNQYHFKTKS